MAALGLGTMADGFLNDVFDVSLPAAIVDQLNDKASINKFGKFVFDHEGVSGRLGKLKGEIEWNDGKNKATYKNELENDGWTGVHRYTTGGEVGQFWQDLFGIHAWNTYQEEGEFHWDIDWLNMEASFGVKDAKTGTSHSGQTASVSIAAKMGVHADFSDIDATLIFRPEFKSSGIDKARIDAPEMVSQFSYGDIDYKGTLRFEVPNVGNCENYFTVNFNEKSECQLNIKSSDNKDPIIIKFKNKFAFVKDGSDIYYVKSENRKGDMVPFDQTMYLSFYYNDHTRGRAFSTIRRNGARAANDLYLTVPLVDAIMSEVLPAAMAYGGKWATFFNNMVTDAPTSVVKAVYWMDKWLPTVQATTFDVSSVVAASRFGYAGYPNSKIVADTKGGAAFLAAAIKKQSFKDLEDAREFVNDIANAENEATQNFALPA